MCEAQSKACSKCGVVKPLGEFYPRRGRRRGRSPTARCRVCKSNDKKAYWMLNKDRLSSGDAAKAASEQRRRWYLAHREEVNSKSRARALANPAERKETSRKSSRKARADVSRGYAASSLCIPSVLLTDDLFTMYREYLLTKRRLQVLFTTIKQVATQ